MAALQRKYQRLSKLIERVVNQSNQGVPLIVEGQRDQRTLRRLGARGKILCVKASGRGLADFLETLRAHSQVMVLTDFDREGVALASRLMRSLSEMRVKADCSLWKQLGGLSRPEVRSIQEIEGYLERLRTRVGDLAS